MECTVNEILDPGWAWIFGDKVISGDIIGISSLIHWWQNLQRKDVEWWEIMLPIICNN